jgi:hypothetical protein
MDIDTRILVPKQIIKFYLENLAFQWFQKKLFSTGKDGREVLEDKESGLASEYERERFLKPRRREEEN